MGRPLSGPILNELPITYVTHSSGPRMGKLMTETEAQPDRRHGRDEDQWQTTRFG